MADLQLVVDGMAYGGWQSISVQLSLETLAGGFELGVTELWPEQGAPREIPAGARCSVRIDGQTVITGHVDAVDHAVGAQHHRIAVSGRDATADLVDCSAVHRKGEWRNVRLDQIARDLAAPFGVAVRATADLGAVFPAFAIEPGESAFECLERAARQRGVLLTTDGQGTLLLCAAGDGGRVATALAMGENLLRSAVRNDQSERFSDYIVKGQRAGDDQVFGEAATQVKATARDTGIGRHRPLLLIDEDQGDIASFQRRARWEASVRAARALTVDCEVQGWRHADGLWRPNTLVQYRDPVLRLQRELLVRDVRFSAGEQGTRAGLVLVPRETYSLEASPESQPAPARGRRAAGGEDAFS